MLYLMMTASLQDIVETDEVTLDIGIRISNTITYSCLSCQVHHDLRMVFLEQLIYDWFVSDTAIYHGIAIELLQSAKSLLLDMHIIVVVHVINAHYLDVLHFLQQSKCQVAADKASSTCHEDYLPR